MAIPVNNVKRIISSGNTMLLRSLKAPITIAGVGGFNASRALSTRNDDPTTASRPFDVSRDGFVMGEGAGALILESLEHAQARGANIIAEVVGGGMAAGTAITVGAPVAAAGAIGFGLYKAGKWFKG